MTRFLNFLFDRSLLLLIGAASALVWANVDHTSYEHASHLVHFAANDIGMVFFFALAARDVYEALLPGRSLSSPRRAATPLIAATGGVLVPALMFVALAWWSGNAGLLRGWAIPCATDIAFSAMVALAIFGHGHPAVPFLLLLAIADDALGLVILALFYPTGPQRFVEGAVLMTLALIVAWLLRRWRVRNFWPYVVLAGGLAWAALYRGGFHPSLALVPIVPFLHHGDERGRDARGEEHLVDPLSAFEHWWRRPVQVVLLFFGFANAGVPLSSVGAGTWIVLASILVGKPLGIVLSTSFATVLGFERPSGLTWSDLVVVGGAAAIGFTVALFFATAAFPEGRYLAETKMAALLSLSGAGLAFGAAFLARVGCFRTRDSRASFG
jgi:NhaA family Na+:H+ antiporter